MKAAVTNLKLKWWLDKKYIYIYIYGSHDIYDNQLHKILLANDNYALYNIIFRYWFDLSIKDYKSYTYNQEEDLAIITQLHRYHTVSNNIKLKTGVFGSTRDGKSFLLKI